MLYASLGGHIKFLEYLSTMCPAQFARTLITPASSNIPCRPHSSGRSLLPCSPAPLLPPYSPRTINTPNDKLCCR